LGKVLSQDSIITVLDMGDSRREFLSQVAFAGGIALVPTAEARTIDNPPNDLTTVNDIRVQKGAIAVSFPDSPDVLVEPDWQYIFCNVSLDQSGLNPENVPASKNFALRSGEELYQSSVYRANSPISQIVNRYEDLQHPYNGDEKFANAQNFGKGTIMFAVPDPFKGESLELGLIDKPDKESADFTKTNNIPKEVEQKLAKETTLTVASFSVEPVYRERVSEKKVRVNVEIENTGEKDSMFRATVGVEKPHHPIGNHPVGIETEIPASEKKNIERYLRMTESMKNGESAEISLITGDGSRISQTAEMEVQT
jgi:hypothetical protein